MADTQTYGAVNPEELDTALKDMETSRDTYTHTFTPPFPFETETFASLSFDWGNLTATDALAVENELSAQGIVIVAPEFSGEYLLRLAVRACTTRRADGRRLGLDAFRAMSVRDYTRIRGRARAFLLLSDL